MNESSQVARRIRNLHTHKHSIKRTAKKYAIDGKEVPSFENATAEVAVLILQTRFEGACSREFMKKKWSSQASLYQLSQLRVNVQRVINNISNVHLRTNVDTWLNGYQLHFCDEVDAQPRVISAIISALSLVDVPWAKLVIKKKLRK